MSTWPHYDYPGQEMVIICLQGTGARGWEWHELPWDATVPTVGTPGATQGWVEAWLPASMVSPQGTGKGENSPSEAFLFGGRKKIVHVLAHWQVGRDEGSAVGALQQGLELLPINTATAWRGFIRTTLDGKSGLGGGAREGPETLQPVLGRCLLLFYRGFQEHLTRMRLSVVFHERGRAAAPCAAGQAQGQSSPAQVLAQFPALHHLPNLPDVSRRLCSPGAGSQWLRERGFLEVPGTGGRASCAHQCPSVPR